jgi:cupin fold WbuC family metalloprotein
MSAQTLDSIIRVDSEALTNLTAAAQAAPRLRMNRNLHTDHSAPVQRLAIAMEPGTYVRPHRHTHSWEVLLPLNGSFSVVVFDDAGKELDRFILGVNNLRVVEMPAGTWHSVAALESGSVIFEVKEGPYIPVTAADVAAWAPEEGSAEAPAFVKYVAGN